MALHSVAIKQSKETTSTMAKAKQLLESPCNLPNATIRTRMSDMIVNVHSDTSYLSKADARSRACGHLIMGWYPKDGDPIKFNGVFYLMCHRFVVASAEVKLGALSLNCKESMIFHLTLEEFCHSQPKTSINCNITTAVGITNNTVKQQC